MKNQELSKAAKEEIEFKKETKLAALIDAKNAIHEFFDYMPDMEELEDRYWEMLTMCLSNQDYEGGYRRNGELTFAHQMTVKLIKALGRVNETLEDLDSTEE